MKWMNGPAGPSGRYVENTNAMGGMQVKTTIQDRLAPLARFAGDGAVPLRALIASDSAIIKAAPLAACQP
ncbi:hypothetical protein [Cupriavidus sp. H18C2]|uniref:hypothetical protein n=1 Tax=Cupriavidus sp. H18C2 TaxID=3241602 RepID=UPI003BF7BE19